jgi:sigma-B regulation protein RsbU (phosphoserine phosphatase)
MTAAARVEHPEAWDWRQLADLGEQLVSTASLSAQRKHIMSTVRHLIKGKVDVWLNENLFRLPDWDTKRLFPAQPPLDGMRRAVKSERLFIHNKTGKAASRGTFAAISLEDQGFIFGALQVTRAKGPGFSPGELDLLTGLGRIVSVGLYAAHRVEVERFRLGQINLVREVSAQIAIVLDIDELARRVTELIQKTFNYYYVAIFTLRADARLLRFRSSATAPRKGKKKASIALEVELGQGFIGEVAQKGVQIKCDDVQADPRFRFLDSLPETRSEVVLPLKVEDRILGVLDVQSDRLKAFHPNDLLILGALADTIARAVDSARLYGNLRRRADQLDLIAEVSKSVTSTLELSQLMADTARLIHEHFGYPYVQLFTVHPNRRLIEYEAGSGKRSAKLKGYNLDLDDPQGIIPWVARESRTVLAKDVSLDPRYRPSPVPPKNTCCELTIPLLFDGKAIGILDIQSDKAHAFNDDDRLMFEAVADTIASAIRNADLYRSEQWRRQVADSLREVAGLLSANVGLDQVLRAILTELDRSLPIDISAIWLMEDGDLRLAAVHGMDPIALQSAYLASEKASLAMASALMSDEPVIRRPDDPLWPAGLAGGFESNYSSIAAPLIVDGQSVGVLTLAHRTVGRYGHEAQAMTTTFASYAAVAIENARLYDAAQEQAYASAALLQVAQAVVSLSDLDEILGSIIRIMPILVGVERIALYLWDLECGAFIPSQEYGLAEQAETALLHEFQVGTFPLLDSARAQNRMIALPLKPKTAPKTWPKLAPSADDAESDLDSMNRLLMAVPISIKQEIYGIMLVEEAAHGRRFRTRRIEIINGIAQQAALAIQNDRLQCEQVVRERLETEVQLARQIQQTFIPSELPRFPAWQLAARWRTARQVGGDFYDVIELSNRKLGLFIADVADKGMPAALFMALTRTLVRAAVIETESPAMALRRVNDLLLPDTRQGMFVTAVYGVLDLDKGGFTYVNAGHNPPLWVSRANSTVKKMTRTGIALGVAEQPNMSEETIQLSAGDFILLYTDGLSEAFSADNEEIFGEARLVETVRSARVELVEDLLVAVEDRLNEFIGDTPLGDDLTMLAVLFAP